MDRVCKILIFAICTIWGNLGWTSSAPSCLQGSINKTTLHDQISNPRQTENHSLLHDYHKNLFERNLKPAAVAKKAIDALCKVTGNAGIIKSLQKNLSSIKESITIPQIKNTCIQGSLKRGNEQPGYFCQNDSSTPTKIGSAGINGPCITSEMTDYLTWATNKAIECLNDPSRPIDPLVIFKKFNNETGFSFFTAYGGGTGLGQLTSTAIEQISGNTNLIENVLKSDRPACQPFKKALSLEPKPTTTAPICQWINPNDGLARNLIYSIGYFLNTRDVLAKHMNRAFQKANIENADYYNYSALALYGRQGLGAQMFVIQAARKYPTNFGRFFNEAKKKAFYLDQVENTYDEALQEGKIPQNESCIEYPEKWSATGS